MPALNSRPFRFCLLFLLSMTELMPVALTSMAIPVLMRRGGASMKQIGIVFLLMFPWSLKAIWAPLIDKVNASSQRGSYSRWLLATHSLLAMTMLLIASMDIPTLMIHQRSVAIPVLIWLTCLCAVADAASHGLAVKLLYPEERGIGNGVQVAGTTSGFLVGGSMMISLTPYAGWRVSVSIMAVIILITIPIIALYKEQRTETPQSIALTEMFALFRSPRIGRWLGVVVMMSFCGALMGPSHETLLVDRGFRLAEIGLVVGILSTTAGICGSILGGLAVNRAGRQRAFYALLIFCALCLGMVSLNRLVSARPILYLLVAIPWCGILARATILQVMMMDRCRRHIPSTDFTIQYTLQHVSRYAGATTGAFVAGHFGAMSVFVLAPLLTLGVAALASRLLDRRDFQVHGAAAKPIAQLEQGEAAAPSADRLEAKAT